MKQGSTPQGAYMVTSGAYVNGGCCFDYGNSETDRKMGLGRWMQSPGLVNVALRLASALLNSCF